MSAPPATAQQQAAVEELELALEWARLHPCPANETPAHWGEADLHDEGLVPLAGPGAPWVAEFAPVDLAAALGITHDAGRQLIADALELAYRLPRLWKRVLAGEVPVWRARLIARETTDLSVKAALFADRLIAATPTPDRAGQGRPAGPGGPAVLRPRPRHRRRGRSPHPARCLAAPRHAPRHHRRHDDPGHPRRAAASTRPSPASPATSKTSATPTSLDVRRARAVGILADPQHALDLLSGREGAAPSPRCPRRCREPLRPPHPRRPRRRPAQLNSTAAPVPPRSRSSARPPPSCSPTGSPGSRQPAPRSPSARSSTSTPDKAVDQHDPPDAMRETVILRDAHCVFPGCRRDSRVCDLDHITEYLPIEDGGPPGQTQPRQSGASVPNPPPREDPHRLALQTPRRRQLRVDRAHRAPVPRHPRLAAYGPGLV